jgi:hypothetical protein
MNFQGEFPITVVEIFQLTPIVDLERRNERIRVLLLNAWSCAYFERGFTIMIIVHGDADERDAQVGEDIVLVLNRVALQRSVCARAENTYANKKVVRAVRGQILSEHHVSIGEQQRGGIQEASWRRKIFT